MPLEAKIKGRLSSKSPPTNQKVAQSDLLGESEPSTDLEDSDSDFQCRRNEDDGNADRGKKRSRDPQEDEVEQKSKRPRMMPLKKSTNSDIDSLAAIKSDSE